MSECSECAAWAFISIWAGLIILIVGSWFMKCNHGIQRMGICADCDAESSNWK